MTGFREPTQEEMSVVAWRLAELRRVFAVWSDNYDDDEFDLLWFAFYEDCDEPVMASAAPYAVGNSLVKKDGFRWVMVPSGGSWHHGVAHPLLAEPIDLLALEGDGWYRPEVDDEPPRPGEAALDSRDFIKLAVEWRRVAGADTPLPKGSFFEVEQQVARARVFGFAAGRSP